MVRAWLRDVAVAHPPHRLDQAEASRRIGEAAGAERMAGAIGRGSRIASRSLAFTPAEISAFGGIDERNALYAAVAPDLAAEAAAPLTRGRQVDFVVTSSCTGYVIPGLDLLLAEKLSLGCELAHLPITEAGCAGGVVALARAVDYLRSHPGRTALAAAVEVCSLAFHPEAEDGNLVSTLIFGDGAGAAILDSNEGEGGLEIVDSASAFVPGTRGAIGFDLTGRGFYPRLARDLADVLPGPARALVERLAGRNGIALADIDAWIVHPGGPAILDALATALRLDADALRWSWQSLAEYGNTSSAAIFDVIRRYRDECIERPHWAVALAFGPGVSIEALLLRSNSA